MAGNRETTDMTAAQQLQVAKAKTTDDVAVEPARPTITRSFSDPGTSSTSVAAAAAAAPAVAAAEPALPEEEQGAGAGSDQQQQQDDLSGYDPIKLPVYDLSATGETASGEAGDGVPPPDDLDWLPYIPGGPASGTVGDEKKPRYL
ncbi:MAG: hypothetical protein L6R36_007505, partial [Xanthoria steineri]